MVSLNFKLLISFNSYIVSDFLYRASRFTTLNDYGKAFFQSWLPPRESFKYEISKDFGKRPLILCFGMSIENQSPELFCRNFLVYCLFLFTAYLL